MVMMDGENMPVADLGYYVVISAKGKKANEIKGLRVT